MWLEVAVLQSYLLWQLPNTAGAAGGRRALEHVGGARRRVEGPPLVRAGAARLSAALAGHDGSRADRRRRRHGQALARAAAAPILLHCRHHLPAFRRA